MYVIVKGITGGLYSVWINYFTAVELEWGLTRAVLCLFCARICLPRRVLEKQKYHNYYSLLFFLPYETVGSRSRLVVVFCVRRC